MMARHVIYIPGLNDHRTFGQNIVIQLWRVFGLTPHYFPLGWNKHEGFEVKRQRILDLIDKLQTENNTVALVGASAGASAALNTFAVSDKVSKVVCISGKINNPHTMSKRLLSYNKDFDESMDILPQSLAVLAHKTADVMSIHPWKDATVPVADTFIKGAAEKTVPGWDHVSGIFLGIIFGAHSIARFIKRGDISP